MTQDTHSDITKHTDINQSNSSISLFPCPPVHRRPPTVRSTWNTGNIYIRDDLASSAHHRHRHRGRHRLHLAITMKNNRPVVSSCSLRIGIFSVHPLRSSTRWIKIKKKKKNEFLTNCKYHVRETKITDII